MRVGGWNPRKSGLSLVIGVRHVTTTSAASCNVPGIGYIPKVDIDKVDGGYKWIQYSIEGKGTLSSGVFVDGVQIHRRNAQEGPVPRFCHPHRDALISFEPTRHFCGQVW